MKNESISRLESLLSQESRNTILLDGEWGVGKTHSLKNIISKNENFKNKKKAYISLFGINSIKELKEALLDSINLSEPQDSVMRSSLKKIRNSMKNNNTEFSFSAPGVSTKIDVTSILSLKKLDNHIICIDDIERRGKDLSLKDTLGYISFLSENNECNVICICNTSYLDEKDQESLKLLYEKVFGYRFKFKTDHFSSLKISLENLEKDIKRQTGSWVVEELSGYEEKNIRLLSLILNGYFYFGKNYQLHRLEEWLQKNITKIFIASCYAHLHYATSLETLNFLPNENAFEIFKPTNSVNDKFDEARRINFFKEYHGIIKNYLLEHEVDIKALFNIVGRNEIANQNTTTAETYKNIHFELFTKSPYDVEIIRSHLSDITPENIKYLDIEKTLNIIKYKKLFPSEDVNNDISKISYAYLIAHPQTNGDSRNKLISFIIDEELINDASEKHKETLSNKEEIVDNVISEMQLLLIFSGHIRDNFLRPDDELTLEYLNKILHRSDESLIKSFTNNLSQNIPLFLEVMYALTNYYEFIDNNKTNDTTPSNRYTPQDSEIFDILISIVKKSKDTDLVMELRIDSALKGIAARSKYILDKI